jgi:hypothetical protein
MKNNTQDLIDNLRKFNRKERFYLVGEALGNKNFKLGDRFIKRLESTINIKIPKNAFAAMDYHLDWMELSIKLNQKEIAIGKCLLK